MWFQMDVSGRVCHRCDACMRGAVNFTVQRRPSPHCMKVALFLGAGASVFAGQPATAKLMEILRERIPDGMGEVTKTIVNNSDYTDIRPYAYSQ